MGTFIAALKSTEGILSTKMMKLLLLTCLAAVALAEPYYPYYHQLQWPSVRAPGFSATCWGCRGKRSADAEPEAEADAYYVILTTDMVMDTALPVTDTPMFTDSANAQLNLNHSTVITVTTLTLMLMDPESLDTPEVPLLTPKEVPKVSAARGPLNPNLITDTHTPVTLITVT